MERVKLDDGFWCGFDLCALREGLCWSCGVRDVGVPVTDVCCVTCRRSRVVV